MLAHLGGYVGPSWGYVGPAAWGLCWPILELCWPILGLWWPNLDAFWALCWAMLAHLELQDRKNGKRKKHCKTRDFRGSAARGGTPFLLRRRRCLRHSHGQTGPRGAPGGITMYPITDNLEILATKSHTSKTKPAVTRLPNLPCIFQFSDILRHGLYFQLIPCLPLIIFPNSPNH